MTNSASTRLDWQNTVLPHAARIVQSFRERGILMTLRQLFYQLVSLPHGHPAKIPNDETVYNTLGRTSAAARRARWFPRLIDPRRKIVVPTAWESPREGIEALRNQYRLDRTAGQPNQLWLGSEKEGLVAQLRQWYGNDYGLPVIALGGQCPQPYIEDIVDTVEADGRPAILLYAGDHDPAGWRILHSFVNRTRCWSNPELPQYDPAVLPPVIGYTKPPGKRSRPQPIPNYNLDRKCRVALTPEQCVEHRLPRNPAKEDDPNMQAFLMNFGDTLSDTEAEDGRGVQIEVDALPPDELRALFDARIHEFWDDDAFQAVLEAEQVDLERLDGILDDLDETA